MEEPTSRLCVKNIPKYLTEKRLKEHFAAKGVVTDVKILSTRDGQPRQMAFIGYRTAEEAQAAVKYFDRTFIDTNRLAVEYARKYKAAEAPRPWSKYSEGSSRHDKLAAAAAPGQQQPAGGKGDKDGRKGKKGAKGLPEGLEGEGGETDGKLEEFLALMQPRGKARVWSNDEVLPGGAGPKPATGVSGAAKKGKQGAAAAGKAAKGAPKKPPPRGRGGAAGDGGGAVAEEEEGAVAFEGDDSDGDEEDTQELGLGAAAASRKLPGSVGGRAARATGNGRGRGGGGGEDDDEDDEESEEEEEEGMKDEAVADAGVSDLEYLRSRMKATLDDDDEDNDDDPAGGGASEESDEDMANDGDDGDGEVEEEEEEEEEDGGGELDAAARGDQAGVGPSGAWGRGGGDGEGGGNDGGAARQILETGRLFVRNLSYSATEAELSDAFGRFGGLEEVHLVLDRDTKRSKGIAYVRFTLPEDAVAAHRALDMTPLQGRLMHVLPSKRHPGEETGAAPGAEQQHGGADGGGADGGAAAASSGGYKSQRDAKRKADAGNRAAWNSLFMRSDTVAEAVAAHYGVSKAQLLDREAADLPVRMALGEAQVIAQTKQALAAAGANVGQLEAAAAASGKAAATKSVSRSPSTLLVKNLPYSADEDELAELFGRAGTVSRLVLPPTRTLALVEYAEPQDARSAFKALAYKKYCHVPLYLEWAPKGIWDTPPPAKPAQGATAKQAGGAAAGADEGGGGDGAVAVAADAGAAARQQQSAAVVRADGEAGGTADEDGDGDGDGGPTGSIYVKNLNFQTVDASLRRHFDRAASAAGARIVSAKVARRKGPDGKLLSLGFGFVELDSQAAAKEVAKQLQGSLLDKHKLQLQLSKHKADGADGKAGKKKSKEKEGGTKLVVRNVAFEATRQDIVGLFGPFGHIKSARLPKKFDGNHRGFAFVEFVTKQEASNALEGVGGTHLYGRRLVVEHAQQGEEGLDELRAKAAARMGAEGGGADEELQPAKRLKRTL